MTYVVPTVSGDATPRPVPVPLGSTDRQIRDVLPAVLRQVPVGVAIVRRDRTIAYYNEAFARMLRLEGTDVALALAPLRRPDGTAFRDGAEPVDLLLRTGRPTAAERVLLSIDGAASESASVEVASTLTPIVDGAGAVLGGIVYADVVGATKEDASLSEAFVGVLSHELRTPITSIYGGAQLLLDDRMPADVRATVVADIAAEAEQLHRLVEDLLAIARVERGVTDVGADPVPLHRLAARAVAAEARRCPGRQIDVRAATDLPAVRADEGYTMQVLRNLISNAVKFSPSDRPVVVTIDEDDDAVRVVIADQGRGFPPGTSSDAFRLFYRSPAVAARVSGTGIGLYVARTLVEAQGGRIWLRNRPDGGAEVGFSLPVYRADDGA